MTDPLAVIITYDELIDALKARKGALKMTDKDLERIAGLADGQVGKIFGIKQAKKLGPISLGLVLQGLCVRLVLVEDVEAMKTMAHRWDKSVSPQTMLANASIPRARWLITSKNARRMRTSQAGAQTPRARKRIAKKAARARWKRHRERKARLAMLAAAKAVIPPPSEGEA